jgi:lysophospholipase L1-like esterase
MLQYFLWSLALGLCLVLLGQYIKNAPGEIWHNCALLFLTFSLLLLTDRLILAYTGLPYWVPDVEAHYKHRPNTKRYWDWHGLDPRVKGTIVEINSHGHHDDEFPEQKPAGELRGLIIGDSVTMGHGVHRSATFSNQLERLLSSPNQIINAGVQGYSTGQELYALKENLRFDPDFIAVGFCLNDITDPAVLDTRFDGVGFFEQMTQSSSWLTGFLLNETGAGRLVQKYRNAYSQEELQQRKSYYDVENLVESPDNPRFAPGWEYVLEHLAQIYQLAKKKEKPVVLLLFPYTFQLFAPDTQRPQQILSEHAAQHDVDVVDFTAEFEDIIDGEIAHVTGDRLLDAWTKKGMHYLYESRFFLDHDHLTPEGHRVVANRIARYIDEKNWAALAPFPREEPNTEPVFDLMVSTDDLEKQVQRSQALLALGHPKLATDLLVLTEGLLVDKGERATIWFHLGRLHLLQRDWPAAKTAFDKALLLHPNWQQALAGLELARSSAPTK